MKNGLEVELKPAYLDYFYIHLPINKYREIIKTQFPNVDQKVIIETDDFGEFETGFYTIDSYGPGFHRWGLRKWYQAHKELKPGNKIKITIIEPMKKYRLEIVN